VLKDSVEAYAYFILAGINSDLARKKRNELEKEMTPAQIRAGQKRSWELQVEIDSRKASKEMKWWEFWR
jgi:hypothetical protein